MCGEAHSTLFHHKGVEREVMALSVYCPHKALGCEWTGELRELDHHLTGGGRGTAREACGYEEVECAHRCGERQQRRFILEHEEESCTGRPLTLQVASVGRRLAEARAANDELKTKLKHVMEDVKARNEAVVVELEDYKRAVDDLKVDNRALRAELAQLKEDHGRQQDESRVAMLAIKEEQKAQRKQAKTASQALVDELAQVKYTFKADIEQIKAAAFARCDFLESQFTPTAPFRFTLRDFNHLKKYALVWRSDSFYSHPRGYKLSVEIHPGGCGYCKGTHMSLHVRVMRGPYDDALEWPFLATVTIEALYGPTNQWRTVSISAFKVTDSTVCTGKPAAGSIGNQGVGSNDTLTHEECVKYVHRDWIRFRASVMY